MRKSSVWDEGSAEMDSSGWNLGYVEGAGTSVLFRRTVLEGTWAVIRETELQKCSNEGDGFAWTLVFNLEPPSPTKISNRIQPEESGHFFLLFLETFRAACFSF
jgi:hypothetical protein